MLANEEYMFQQQKQKMESEIFGRTIAKKRLLNMSNSPNKQELSYNKFHEEVQLAS